MEIPAVSAVTSSGSTTQSARSFDANSVVNTGALTYFVVPADLYDTYAL